jgi:hypothetical protein
MVLKGTRLKRQSVCGGSMFAISQGWALSLLAFIR